MVKMIQGILFIIVAAMIGVTLYWQVDIIRRGGPVMIPIVMCSIFSLSLMLERLAYFVRIHLGRDIDRFFEQFKSMVEGRRWQEAQQLAQALGGPVGRVALAGLASRDGAPEEIDDTMQEAAHVELPAIEQHLRSLSTLAQVSTLLGLLGTVTGLVSAFQVVQTKSAGGNPVSPGDLAGGIWEALITTVAGLIVAIPTILAYNYFAGRVGEVQFQMEKAAGIIAGWRRPIHGLDAPASDRERHAAR
jgi:biopolymer transport protein ExbB